MISVFSTDPKAVLKTLEDLIKAGKIDTWSIDSDGDYTHTPAQWIGKAWLRPRPPLGDRVIFNMLTRKGLVTTKTLYAVYHGRFAEMLLTHADLLISKIDISSMPQGGDIISSP